LIKSLKKTQIQRLEIRRMIFVGSESDFSANKLAFIENKLKKRLYKL